MLLNTGGARLKMFPEIKVVYKNNTRRENQALQCALPVTVVLTSKSVIKDGNMSYN